MKSEKYKTKPNNPMNTRTFYFGFDENEPKFEHLSHFGAVFRDLRTIRIFHLTEGE